MTSNTLSNAFQALETLIGEGADLEATDAAIAQLTPEQRHAMATRLDHRLAELQARAAANTGLPSPDCGTKQQRLAIENQTDGSLVVRISYQIPAAKRTSELKGLARVLKGFAT